MRKKAQEIPRKIERTKESLRIDPDKITRTTEAIVEQQTTPQFLQVAKERDKYILM